MLRRLKGLKGFWGSFRIRVTLALVFSLFLVVGLSDIFIFQFTLRGQLRQLRERLMSVAQTASLMIDGDTLIQIPLNKGGIYTPQYQAIYQQLKRIKEANNLIEFIYTLAKTDHPGILQFVVDLNPVLGKGVRHGPTAFPGDKYYAFRFPEMLRGFRGASADNNVMADEWGRTLSAYAPVRNAAGNTVAIIGIDMSAGDVYALRALIYRRLILVMIAGFLVSIILGLLLSKTITERIEKLVEGTRRISADELDYSVQIRGHDEISELADSFNNMARSLSESKKRLQDYFFRVVQSLVRILEAKDEYTRGHSERVAEYSRTIALEMGFSKGKAEMLEKAAELHDIGKLVIHEDILNKKGKLTEEEWGIIKEHPILGEEVLRPVFLDEDMLAMVRSHHERYDGEGYPDKKKGDNINIFAQIISVADAYDAMTSSRAYRQALSKEEATGELKKNCGSQFNTQVVKSFLRALGERE